MRCLRTIITLPPDLEERLAEEARRQGMSPERLALDSLRKVFMPVADHGEEGSKTLWDFLCGYIGTESGSAEALSEDCGRRFTDILVEKQQQGQL